MKGPRKPAYAHGVFLEGGGLVQCPSGNLDIDQSKTKNKC